MLNHARFLKFSSLGTALTFLVILGVVCPAETCAQTKVCQFDVSIQVNEDIVRFDVTVDEAHLVDALNG